MTALFAALHTQKTRKFIHVSQLNPIVNPGVFPYIVLAQLVRVTTLKGLIMSEKAPFETLIEKAYSAASDAIKIEFDREPESATAFDCGFAWVIVEDSRSPFPTWCRMKIKEKARMEDGRMSEVYYGDKGYPTGWQFWCPGTWPSYSRYQQSERMWRKGAEAFCKVLNEAGIKARYSSRLD